MSDNLKDVDRLGCESCPDNPENREYLQQRGVSISGIDGRPKGNPVLEAIDDATQPESGGITTEQHNEMLDDIRIAYLQNHQQGPDGHVVPGNGGEFEMATDRIEKENKKTIVGCAYTIRELTSAHNADRAADKKRIAKLEAQRDNLHRIVCEIRDTFYGQNMSVIGWHLNGDPEPMDSFFDEHDWEISDADRQASEDKQRIADLEDQLRLIMSAIPCGNIATHTTANAPGRIRDLVSECSRLEEDNHRLAELEQLAEVLKGFLDQQTTRSDNAAIAVRQLKTIAKKRIAELKAQLSAAKNPRVMKRWGVDGVPAPGVMCWLLVGGIMHKESLSDNEIRQCRIAGCAIPGKITHWLELEPAPTLPENSDGMIAGDGD